jgi:hypothetical protein
MSIIPCLCAAARHTHLQQGPEDFYEYGVRIVANGLEMVTVRVAFLSNVGMTKSEKILSY